MKAIILICSMLFGVFFGGNIYKPEEITHFFTHSLLAYPTLAFQDDNPMRKAYDIDCITPSEFESFLEEMYQNNFVLVDIYDTFDIKSGKTKDISLPKNKRPLVLSFDDVNYYIKKMHLGMIDRLTIDKDGKLASFTQNASPQLAYDNEHILIVENFIRRHPDFSHNGARGVLCLTGFDGILGYRTQCNSPNREDEIAKVKPLIAKLKSLNWRFASHSYGHNHMRKQSTEAFKQDAKKWKNEVEPIIGKTAMYCYPYGEWDINNGAKLTEKQTFLNEEGFKLFFGVGVKNFYRQMPYDVNMEGKIWLMDRKPLDGFSIRNARKAYSPFFDCSKTYDHKHRHIPFPA